jgi:hypothetical protein
MMAENPLLLIKLFHNYCIILTNGELISYKIYIISIYCPLSKVSYNLHQKRNM